MSTPDSRRTCSRSRPSLEALEDRTVLTASASASVLGQGAAVALASTTASSMQVQYQSVATAARIVSADSQGGSASSLSVVRVTFDRSMNASTFTPADITFTGPDGKAVAVSSVKAVAGSADRVYDITFAAQTKAGSYTFKVGTDIKGWDGRMSTAFQKSFTVAGAGAQATTNPLALTNAVSINGSATSMNTIRLSFDRAVNASTFTTADVALTGPDGKAIAVTVKAVAGYSGNVFDVTFAAQTKGGTYTLKVGPAINDANGVAMSAAVTRTFSLAQAAAPLALSNAVSVYGSATSMNTIRLSFDRAVNASTLTAADVSLVGPDGKAITAAVKAVAGYAGNVFDVTFPAQTKPGTYTLKVGPAINDSNGVAMSAVVTRTFTVSGSTGSSSVNALPTAYSSKATANVPPRGTGGSTITVGRSAPISTVLVSVNITTARASELKVWLQAPDGTIVTLVDRDGGNAVNFVDAMFTDSAPGAVPANKSTVYGTFTPDSPLSVLTGKNMAGTWKLWVQDQAGVRSSVLTGWSMIITPVA